MGAIYTMSYDALQQQQQQQDIIQTEKPTFCEEVGDAQCCATGVDE